MQSSSSVIKSNSVIKQGSKEIITNLNSMPYKEAESFVETNAKNYIDSYENLAKNMIENARKQSDQIMLKAYEDAQVLETEAINKGYEKGYKEGVEKAYSESIGAALEKSEEIILNAEKTLKNAKEEYDEYLVNKREEIKDLIITTVEAILKREVLKDNSLNEMIFDALCQAKNSSVCIIRCNSIYCNELKQNTKLWKEQLAFAGDIFIVEDNNLDIGNAVVEKSNGKVMVGIEYGLQTIKELLEEND